MKKIKQLNENEIKVDGCIYRKVEEPESEFKAGDWVVQMMKRGDELGRIKTITNNHIEYDDGSGHSSWNGYIRHATKYEIESHLRRICDEKYPVGTKFRGLYGGLIGTNNGGFNYYENTDQLTNGRSIYLNGKWAEIIPDKKKRSKTKNERLWIASLVFHYL